MIYYNEMTEGKDYKCSCGGHCDSCDRWGSLTSDWDDYEWIFAEEEFAEDQDGGEASGQTTAGNQTESQSPAQEPPAPHPSYKTVRSSSGLFRLVKA